MPAGGRQHSGQFRYRYLRPSGSVWVNGLNPVDTPQSTPATVIIRQHAAMLMQQSCAVFHVSACRALWLAYLTLSLYLYSASKNLPAWRSDEASWFSWMLRGNSAIIAATRESMLGETLGWLLRDKSSLSIAIARREGNLKRAGR